MDSRDLDHIGRWLDAERRFSDEEADELFMAVATRCLPRTPPPDGLSARVMASVGRRRGGVLSGLMAGIAASRWARAGLTVAVVVLGGAFSTVSANRVFDVAAGGVEALARFIHAASSSLTAALGVWGATWTLLNVLGRAAAAVVTTSPGPLLLTGNLLMACLASVGLSRLLAPREEQF